MKPYFLMVLFLLYNLSCDRECSEDRSFTKIYANALSSIKISYERKMGTPTP